MGPSSSQYLSYRFRKQIFLLEVAVVTAIIAFLSALFGNSLIESFQFATVTVLVWAVPATVYIKLSQRRADESITPNYVNKIGAIGWFAAMIGLVGSAYAVSVYTNLTLFSGVYLGIFLSPFLYNLRLFLLSSTYYNTEILFYYSEDSVASREWYDASVYLSKATKYIDSDNRINPLGLFYSRLSVGRYQDVIDVAEENNQMQEIVGATLLARAAYELYWAYISQLYSVQKTEEHVNNFLYLTDEAHSELSIRVCTVCGNKENIEDTYHIVDDESNYYVCMSCYKSAQYDESTESSRYTQDYTADSQYANGDSRHTSAGANKTAERGSQQISDQTVNSLCSVLDISKPLTESKIESAYREKVKEVHPDMENGSVDDFKQVSEAKTKLLRYIE